MAEVLGDETPGNARGDDGSGALGLLDAAARHGAFCWTERRLFALAGAWAAAPGLVDEARPPLFTLSAQHAWHAQLWADRLPVLADVDREGLVRPPGSSLELTLGFLEPGGTSGGSSPAAEAAGFVLALSHVVLPGLLAAYRAYGKRLVGLADGPAQRALALIVRDETEELADVARLAAAVRSAEHGSAHAEAVMARLEDVAGAGGARDGLFPW